MRNTKKDSLKTKAYEAYKRHSEKTEDKNSLRIKVPKSEYVHKEKTLYGITYYKKEKEPKLWKSHKKSPFKRSCSDNKTDTPVVTKYGDREIRKLDKNARVMFNQLAKRTDHTGCCTFSLMKDWSKIGINSIKGCEKAILILINNNVIAKSKTGSIFYMNPRFVKSPEAVVKRELIKNPHINTKIKVYHDAKLEKNPDDFFHKAKRVKKPKLSKDELIINEKDIIMEEEINVDKINPQVEIPIIINDVNNDVEDDDDDVMPWDRDPPPEAKEKPKEKRYLKQYNIFGGIDLIEDGT